MPKPLHILTHTLVGGGAEKQMLLCAEALAKSGRQVCLWAMSQPVDHPRYAPLLARCRAAGVIIHTANGLGGKMRLLLSLSVAVARGGLLWTWGFRAELLRLILPPLWIPRGITSFRDAGEVEMRKRAWILRLARPLTVAYIANSEKSIDLANRRVPGVRRRSHTLYNAVEASFLDAPPASLARPNGRLRLAMLGNLLMNKKGYDVAVQAAALLKQRGADFEILIGGAPHDLESFSCLCESLGVTRHVRYVGKVSDPVKFLSDADAYLLLSRYEGTPNALLEAMSVALPCASTDVGDVALFAKECPALTLLPIGDAEAVVRCVENWIRNPSESRRSGAACRAYCRKRFSEQAMGESLQGIFARL